MSQSTRVPKRVEIEQNLKKVIIKITWCSSHPRGKWQLLKYLREKGTKP